MGLLTSVRRAAGIWPYGRTLISFDARGCMAHDWRERDRGVVTGYVRRKIYGSGPDGCGYWVVTRPDGSTFDAYEGYCMPGESDMQPRTDNPDEELPGKMVYVA